MEIARERSLAERDLDFLDAVCGEGDEALVTRVLARAQGEVRGVVVGVNWPLRHGVEAGGGEIILPRGDGVAGHLGLQRHRLALFGDAPHLAGDIGEFADRSSHGADIAGPVHPDRAEHFLGHRPVEIRPAEADEPVIEPFLLAHASRIGHRASYWSLCIRGGKRRSSRSSTMTKRLLSTKPTRPTSTSRA